MSVWDQPSPSDIERARERVANGEPISQACQAEGFTLTRLRQCNRQAWFDLRTLWHDVQGVEDRHTARETFRQIATDTSAENKDRITAGVQLAKSSGYLTERVEVTGADGGPVQIEHEERLTLADVAAFAAQLRPRAGAGGELPVARELLPAPEDDLASAGDVPARRRA